MDSFLGCLKTCSRLTTHLPLTLLLCLISPSADFIAQFLLCIQPDPHAHIILTSPPARWPPAHEWERSSPATAHHNPEKEHPPLHTTWALALAWHLTRLTSLIPQERRTCHLTRNYLFSGLEEFLKIFWSSNRLLITSVSLIGNGGLTHLLQHKSMPAWHQDQVPWCGWHG